MDHPDRPKDRDHPSRADRPALPWTCGGLHFPAEALAQRFTSALVRPRSWAGRGPDGREPMQASGRSDGSFDAVVVGGGPGGSAAAYHLATGGARVLLVEKAAYPRDKVCGDGVTLRAVAAIDAMGLQDAHRDWPRNVGLRIHGAGHHRERPVYRRKE